MSLEHEANKLPEIETVHVKSGDSHVVGIANLKVVLVHEEGSWFAQGLDIAYSAEGNDLDAVKTAFETGFCATIHEHLKVYANLDKFLVPAPPEIWKEMFYEPSSDLKSYTQLSYHDLSAHQVATRLPYNAIQYILREKVAA